ncbi:MAG: hypothetical protein QNJ70_22655 [Xenococcaceae cyanobacterium MO_207.B15]|nr:hypothetical protein [Xenococcaceae cyanobacterium MO_207.B15]
MIAELVGCEARQRKAEKQIDKIQNAIAISIKCSNTIMRYSPKIKWDRFGMMRCDRFLRWIIAIAAKLQVIVIYLH